MAIKVSEKGAARSVHASAYSRPKPGGLKVARIEDVGLHRRADDNSGQGAASPCVSAFRDSGPRIPNDLSRHARRGVRGQTIAVRIQLAGRRALASSVRGDRLMSASMTRARARLVSWPHTVCRARRVTPVAIAWREPRRRLCRMSATDRAWPSRLLAWI